MAKKITKSVSFEEALKELEVIVNHLESGGLSLDESLSEFERGVTLVKHGQKQLQQAEQRIQILLNDNVESDLAEFNLSEE
ncbi:exodeoxyribonuclease VII small subunit [Candidatus Schmidhempelia bombi]|jgi:exodeoxyribonuclease VII small subunit|uniref:Exodeoxyribonuclease 7 small subunit n=1 Tax=Candidatus Schmidhempelia bombi str. Bimp TaxID=1387197 RepID=A0AB94ICJ6_9GAMM|nr:exodeoxyribonuclease VII small subunit [Candidatus Schmidhempelia bombi]TEA27139.1 exodeoxyribonuclease VII small subunit [Candidatus Schmidhempelia bombi str. Bimp]